MASRHVTLIIVHRYAVRGTGTVVLLYYCIPVYTRTLRKGGDVNFKSAMAATFIKNKSKIEAVLEHNLAVVAPKLHSVNLISDEDRDQALNSSVDSKTRAAVLINTIERKIVDYRSWWILVYVLLFSGLDAERAFF